MRADRRWLLLHLCLWPGLLLGAGFAFAVLPSTVWAQTEAGTAPTNAAAASRTALKPAPDVTPDPTFRVNTNLVLVPTLVEQGNGSVVYGLGADAFLTDR